MHTITHPVNGVWRLPFGVLRRINLPPFANADLEYEFLSSYRSFGARNCVAAALYGALAYASFFLFDLAESGWHGGTQTWRLVFVAFFLFTAGGLTFFRDGLADHYVEIVAAIVAISFIGTTALGVTTDIAVKGPLKTATGAMLAAFILYGFLRLPVVVASAIGWSAIPFLGAASYAGLSDAKSTVSAIISISAMNAAGFYLARGIERRERDLFVATSRANSRSVEKVRLVGQVAHDVRGPLQAAAISLAALNLGAKALSTEAVAERVRQVGASIEELREYAEHLLSLCRYEGSAFTPALETVGIEAFLNGVVDSVTVRAQEVGVQVNYVGLGLRSGACVLTNRLELWTVVSNLLDNAIKFRDESKHSGAFARVSVRCAAGALEICVEDNGIGIAPENMAEIWHVGFQVNNPCRDAKNGIGFGLAMVRSRIDRLDGHTVRVQSELGIGTRFVVTVPLA